MQKIMNRPVMKERRKELWRVSTDAEVKFWQAVRARRFLGLKFVRQFGAGPYIIDFFCAALKLAIELDGSQHNEVAQKEYDQLRTDYLSSLRIRVIRFWNHDVLKDMEGVLAAIKLTLTPHDLKRGSSKVITSGLAGLGSSETPSSDEEGAGGV